MSQKTLTMMKYESGYPRFWKKKMKYESENSDNDEEQLAAHSHALNDYQLIKDRVKRTSNPPNRYGFFYLVS